MRRTSHSSCERLGQLARLLLYDFVVVKQTRWLSGFDGQVLGDCSFVEYGVVMSCSGGAPVDTWCQAPMPHKGPREEYSPAGGTGTIRVSH